MSVDSRHEQVAKDQIGQLPFGAGSILSLTANPPPSGQAFAQWNGAGVSNATAPTTLFIMPPTNAVVSATYTNLPAPQISSTQAGAGNQLQIQSLGIAGQAYVLQRTTNFVNWIDVSTNNADTGGHFLWNVPIDPTTPGQFFRVRFP